MSYVAVSDHLSTDIKVRLLLSFIYFITFVITCHRSAGCLLCNYEEAEFMHQGKAFLLATITPLASDRQYVYLFVHFVGLLFASARDSACHI